MAALMILSRLNSSAELGEEQERRDSEGMEEKKQRMESNHGAETMENTKRSKELNDDVVIGELRSDERMITEDDNMIDATKGDWRRPCFDFLGHSEKMAKKKKRIESDDDAANMEKTKRSKELNDDAEVGDQMMITEDDNITDVSKGDVIRQCFDFLGLSGKMDKKNKRVESHDDGAKMEQKKKQRIESNDDADIGESRSDQPMVREENIIAATKGDMICPSFHVFAHNEKMERKERIESTDDSEKVEKKKQSIESNDDAERVEKKHRMESNDDVERVEKKKQRIESNDEVEKKKPISESNDAAEIGELKSDKTMIAEDDDCPISLDVMEKIFARLPLKSMFQLRVLSKFWSSNIFSANFRGEVHSYWKKVPPTSKIWRGLMYIEKDDDAHELFDWLTVKHQSPPPDKTPRPQPAVLCPGS